MTRRHGIGARRAVLVASLALACGPAARDAAAAPAARWASLGVLTGSTGFGARLADYQWDVAPRAAWGAQALAGAGRFGWGVRLWHASSAQAIASAPGGAAGVGLTSLALVGRTQLARRWGTELAVTGSAGWLRLAYDPDQVEVPVGGGAPPVVVALEPVSTWNAGAGIAARRVIAGPWSAGLELEGRVFPVEAAHRNADTIVTGRETFGDWSARLELARVWDRR